MLERALWQHRRRFRLAGRCATRRTRRAAPREVTGDGALLAADVDPAWLARAGRFAHQAALTNTLGVADAAQAVRLFLRERAAAYAPTGQNEICSFIELSFADTKEKIGKDL